MAFYVKNFVKETVIDRSIKNELLLSFFVWKMDNGSGLQIHFEDYIPWQFRGMWKNMCGSV